MNRLIRKFWAGSRIFNSPFQVISAGYIYKKNYFLVNKFSTINFCFILGGRGKFYWKGKFLNVISPCVTVQPPDIELQFGPTNEETWDTFFFSLPKKAISYVIDKGLWDGDFPIWEIGNLAGVIESTARLRSLLEHPLESINLDRLDYMCEQLLIESRLFPVDGSAHHLEGTHKHLDVINRIMEDVKSLEVEVDFQHYSEVYGISVPTLRRYWMKYIGVPPNKFRIHLLIKIACDLLVHTDKSVVHIASELHFSDQFYFSRQFKKETGYSPSTYRKMFEISN